MKKKTTEKKYSHIAVSPELKERFEKLRFRLTGEKEKEITHGFLLNILLDKYNEKVKK